MKGLRSPSLQQTEGDGRTLSLECQYQVPSNWTLQANLEKGNKQQQEAQLPQRNSASAVHVYLGWLTDHAMHRTPQNRTGCTISDI